MRQDLTRTSTQTPSVPHDAQFDVGVIPPAERRCLNCQTIMQGPYCFQCGQHEKSSIRHFGVFVRDVIDDVFNLDSRAVRTIKPLLFSPGFLTKEYLSGRRMRYVPPLRLYVIASLVFFLMINLVVPHDLFKNRFYIETSTTQIIAQQLIALQAEPDVIALRKDADFERLFVQAQQHAQWSEQQKQTFAKDMQTFVRTTRDKHFRNFILTTVEEAEDVEKQAEKAADAAAELQGKAITAANQVNKVPVKAPAAPPIPTSPLPATDKGRLTLFGGLTQAQNPWLYSLQERANERWQELRNDPDQIKENVFRLLPQSMFLMLPLFALMLKMFYPFSNRLYSEHLITAVHSHSFMFLLMALLISSTYASTQFAQLHSSLNMVDTVVDWIVIAGWIWLPIYLFMMQYTVYAQGFFVTLLKFTFVGSFYIALLGIVLAVDFLISLLRY